ncbi:hypothetical protein ODGCJCGO_00072 [Enterococcus phage EFKL]|nr:hypothetical protein ODGCJCGO_00072 [Enterococcus phage EFKL]
MRNERAPNNIILKLFLGRCVRCFSERYVKGVSKRNLKANLERQVQSFAMDLFLLELLRSLCGML